MCGLTLAVTLALAACVKPPPSAAEGPPELSRDEVVRRIPGAPADKDGWARDILAALGDARKPKDEANVCAVIAIIAQESSFEANPVVPGLPTAVDRRLDEEAEKLGPLGRPAFATLLEGHAPADARSFRERLRTVRTERDVDLVFRDLLTYERQGHPFLFATANAVSALSSHGRLEDLNPITTAGSMQVSVRYAQELAQKSHRADDSDTVRDALYTRYGGVLYGTHRLLGYEADYPEMRYRFADYNAGMYSSRNAALQVELTVLTGIRLAPDGDLLAYDARARPLEKETESLRALEAFRAEYAPELSEERLRADLRHEKEAGFSESATVRTLEAAYEAKTHRKAPRVAMPEVAIHSVKMKADRSTRWYADSVERRFERCLKR